MNITLGGLGTLGGVVSKTEILQQLTLMYKICKNRCKKINLGVQSGVYFKTPKMNRLLYKTYKR
jgi:hypothetical protein